MISMALFIPFLLFPELIVIFYLLLRLFFCPAEVARRISIIISAAICVLVFILAIVGGII